MADSQKVIHDAASQLVEASKELSLKILQMQGDLKRVQSVLDAIRDACEHDYEPVPKGPGLVMCRNCFRITLSSDV